MLTSPPEADKSSWVKDLLKKKQRSILNGLLPKSFFAGSETFFDKSKARSRRFQNSPFGLKQLKSLFFHFAKIYEQKTFQ
jgi:hypothetical protein